MGIPLRVLMLEDSEEDATLALHELRRYGYEPVHRRVQTADGLTAALREQPWDIVLSDHDMPGFNFAEALKLFRASGVDLPFILVTGTIGEEAAVLTVKAGVHDYILKDNLARLGSAVERELQESKVRQEARRVAQALRFTEDIYRRAIAAAEAVPYQRDYATETFTYLAPGIQELTGYTPREMTPALWESLVQECHFRGALGGLTFAEAAQKVRSGEVLQWRCDCLVKTRDGGSRWVSDASVEMVDAAGKSTGSVGVLQDITARVQMQEALQSSEKHYRSLMEGLPDAVLVNGAGRFRFLNSAACRLFKASASGQLLGELILDRVHPDFRTSFQERVGHCLEGQTAPLMELKALALDGGEVDVEATAQAIQFEGSPAVLSIFRDITEKKRLETQFLRAQRLQSLGTLASGIAHDLNNALAPILMAIELLRSSRPDQEDKHLLETLSESTQRASGMVRQVLTFARGAQGQRMPVQVAHLIKELVLILKQTFSKAIYIHPSLPRGLWPVMGDATQLHQVFMNLCVNARDAMPEGGTLTLAGENLIIDEQFAAGHLEAKPGPHLLISVTDTGTGMAPEVRSHVFEPFFTTKAVGQGTGLGLATAQGIVRGHGGFISLTSEVGQGTQFKVYLPAQPSEAPAPAAEELTSRFIGHGETVLVVDDEAAIRDITTQTLRMSNYQVITARDGAEATARFAAHRDRIRVVLTDLLMPVMDGVALVRALRSLNPEIKVILSSGIENESKEAELARMELSALLRKPYTAHELLETIHKVLAAP